MRGEPAERRHVPLGDQPSSANHAGSRLLSEEGVDEPIAGILAAKRQLFDEYAHISATSGSTPKRWTSATPKWHAGFSEGRERLLYRPVPTETGPDQELRTGAISRSDGGVAAPYRMFGEPMPPVISLGQGPFVGLQGSAFQWNRWHRTVGAGTIVATGLTTKGGIVLVTVTVAGEAHLRALGAWLANEPGVRQARVTGPAPAADEQGGLLDVIQMIVSDGMSLASLVVAVKQWQASTTHAPDVTIESSDGTRETVPGTDPQAKPPEA